MTAANHTWPEQGPGLSETRGLDTPGSLELLDALRTENDQLRTALVSRIVIEQAKGMLAERWQVEVDVAFERLRREARSRRLRLHALAGAVVAGEPWTKHIFRTGAGGGPR